MLPRNSKKTLLQIDGLTRQNTIRSMYIYIFLAWHTDETNYRSKNVIQIEFKYLEIQFSRVTRVHCKKNMKPKVWISRSGLRA